MAQEIKEIAQGIPKERYFDNQLLGVQDFEREQAYHIAQRELQTRLFYTPGVLAGLAIQNGGAAGQIQVLAGVAINGKGCLIILAGQARFDGANLTAQAAKFILDLNQHPSSYTAGQEKKWLLALESDPTPEARDNQWLERPLFSLVPASAGPGINQIALARVNVQATKQTDTSSGKPVVTLAVDIDMSIQLPATLSPERFPILDANKIRGKLEPGVIPDLDAGQIKSGKLNASVIPDLNADKIKSGKLAIDLIPDLNADKIKSGKLAVNLIPDLDASQIKTGKLAAGLIPDLDAAQIKTGKLIPSVIPALSADSIPDLDAGKIKSGKLAAQVIPNLDAGQIKTGKLDIAQIPDISADKISSGKLKVGVIPNLDASQITSGILSKDRLPPDLLPPDQQKPKWQATVARPGGKDNKVRVLRDASGFVHFSGTITPTPDPMTKVKTDDLLQIPAACTPDEDQIFRILDKWGDPWEITVFATAGKSMKAVYLGSKPTLTNNILSLAGLSYALMTSLT